MIRINVTGRAEAGRKIRAMIQHLRPGGRRRMLRRIGRVLRDAVRRRFTTQGDGAWPSLSHWTRAKTSRRKALLPLRGRIHYRLVGDNQIEVFFDPPSTEWNIQMHHRGFRSRAVDNKRMVIPLKSPAILGVSGSRLIIKNRRTSVIPARRVWLTPEETRRTIEDELLAFAREIENA